MNNGTAHPAQVVRYRRGYDARDRQPPRLGIITLPTSSCIVLALGWQIAAFAFLAAQLVLVCVLGAPAMLVGLVGILGLFIYRPLAGVTVFLQILLYQNLFLSIFSGSGIDQSSFTAFQGFAFGAIACMAAVSVVRMFRSAPNCPSARRLTAWICASLVLIGVYTVYGAVGSAAVSALIYFRNTSAMLLALLVGLDVGRTWDYRTIATVFLASVAVGLLMAIVEYALPHAYFTAIHVRDYVHMRSQGEDVSEIARSVDELIAHRTVTWFNVTGGAGGAQSVRIFGPNMFAVSYAYVIACAGIVGATLGRPAVAGLALCLLVFAGVKGPLLMLAITLSLSVVWWVTRSPRAVVIVSVTLLIAYVFEGIRIGLSNGDFHVIGLLGGVNGFVRKPWGHGIGVGGNLSAEALKGLNWQEWQKSVGGADFALESAIGVLLYQMGVAALAVYTPIIGCLRKGMSRQPLLRLTDLLFIGIAVTLANGFFQEEAYSPYALGLLTLFGGVAASNVGVRMGPAR